MKSVIGLLRNMLAFVVLLLVYFFAALVMYLVIVFFNTKLDHTSYMVAMPWAVILGSSIGMKAAVTALDQWFTPYPKRLFAGLFVGIWGGLTVLAIIAQVVNREPFEFKDFTSGLGVVVACIAAWVLMWRRPQAVKIGAA